MTKPDEALFEDISIAALRRRKSEKWTKYPPDILPAFVAEMDFPVAAPIRDAITAAVRQDDYGYAHPAELGAAFADFASSYFAWRVNPDHVFAAPDVMAGIEQVLSCFTQPGVGIVINPPVYPPFFELLRSLGRPIVEVPLVRANGDGWRTDLAGMERAFASGAKGYILCSPHNPIGRAWPSDELKAMLALADAYRVTVVADEIHAPMTLGGSKHTPLLSVAGETDRVFAVTSASKAWNIPGLKCAVVVAGSERTRDALQRRWQDVPTETTDRVGHLGVLASIAAFRDGLPWLASLCAHLDRNRHLLVDLLQQHIPRARYAVPDTGFLAWIDCSALALGDDPAARFLERGRVALLRGLNFGSEGAGWLRLNFGTSGPILSEIVRRMALALDEP